MVPRFPPGLVPPTRSRREPREPRTFSGALGLWSGGAATPGLYQANGEPPLVDYRGCARHSGMLLRFETFLAHRRCATEGGGYSRIRCHARQGQAGVVLRHRRFQTGAIGPEAKGTTVDMESRFLRKWGSRPGPVFEHRPGR